MNSLNTLKVKFFFMFFLKTHTHHPPTQPPVLTILTNFIAISISTGSTRAVHKLCNTIVEILRPSSVVYFDQCLGAAHPKRWSRYAFFMFLMAKSLHKYLCLSLIPVGKIRVPIVKTTAKVILHVVVIMLISMMVPTFKICPSFLYKKGCTAPKHRSEYKLCLPNILNSLLLWFFLLMGLGCPATSWLGCTAKNFSLFYLLLKLKLIVIFIPPLSQNLKTVNCGPNRRGCPGI